MPLETSTNNTTCTPARDSRTAMHLDSRSLAWVAGSCWTCKPFAGVASNLHLKLRHMGKMDNGKMGCGRILKACRVRTSHAGSGRLLDCSLLGELLLGYRACWTAKTAGSTTWPSSAEVPSNLNILSLGASAERTQTNWDVDGMVIPELEATLVGAEKMSSFGGRWGAFSASAASKMTGVGITVKHLPCRRTFYHFGLEHIEGFWQGASWKRGKSFA